jgi:Pyruvate/2-oxoacid:ferredoxin oxidoreductase delta subunit
MCEFCLKHGEGKKWYLETKNYSEDLLNDMSRRKMLKEFYNGLETAEEDIKKRLEALDKAPAVVKRILRWKTVRKMKKFHYGQIVPLEDVERIFGFVNSIIRVACICRYVTLKEEKRYCYGISMGPGGGKLAEIFAGLDTSFLGGPDSKGREVLSKEEAMANFREHEKAGLCHSVWTFQTPFIGGICNCDRPDCLAMQMSLTHGFPMIFRGEYVAESHPEKCTGCRQCMRVCQFGAIGYSAARNKAFVDPRRCFGCGICRAVCKTNAVELRDRAQVPVAAQLWQ